MGAKSRKCRASNNLRCCVCKVTVPARYSMQNTDKTRICCSIACMTTLFEGERDLMDVKYYCRKTMLKCK